MSAGDRGPAVHETLRHLLRHSSETLRAASASPPLTPTVYRDGDDIALAFEHGAADAAMLTDADRQAAGRFRHAARQSHFLLGRAAANRALAALGAVPPRPVGTGPNGEPLWPEGFAGSITHAADAAAAVVVRAAWGAIGIDLESTHRRIDPDMADYISDAAERAAAEQCCGSRTGMLVAFSMKEAAIKALRPARASGLDFRGILLRDLRADDGLLLCTWRYDQRAGRAQAILGGESVLSLAVLD